MEVQEALEAQWLLFKPDSWKAQAVGKGGPVLFAARFRTQAGRREQKKRQGQRPCLLADPLSPPLPHTKFRRPGEGGMYHEPRWRGKGSCGVWSPIPGSYTCLSRAQAPAPSPLPLGQAKVAPIPPQGLFLPWVPHEPPCSPCPPSACCHGWHPRAKVKGSLGSWGPGREASCDLPLSHGLFPHQEN